MALCVCVCVCIYTKFKLTVLCICGFEVIFIDCGINVTLIG